MSAIKLALQQNQKRDRRKTSEAKSAEVSPDSKCPICLDVFNNIAYLDICLHKFCFRCIHEWSKNKAWAITLRTLLTQGATAQYPMPSSEGVFA